jgi:hypothetical protein
VHREYPVEEFRRDPIIIGTDKLEPHDGSFDPGDDQEDEGK